MLEDEKEKTESYDDSIWSYITKSSEVPPSYLFTFQTTTELHIFGRRLQEIRAQPI